MEEAVAGGGTSAGGDAISGAVGDGAHNVVIGKEVEQRSATQNIYQKPTSSHDLLAAVLARLEVFDHRFEILNNRLAELVGMRRDIDDIRHSVRELSDTEPKIIALEQKVTFHINLMWIVVAVLMVGLALLWMRG